MKLKYILVASAFLSLMSCMDMDIDNMNNPDTEVVQSNPEAMQAMVGGLFKIWFGIGQDASYSYSTETPARAMWYMADGGTTYWANFGAVDLSMEPREAFINEPTYPYHWVAEAYYKNTLSVLTSATDAVGAIDNGMQFGKNGEDTPMVLAMSKLVQGLSNGYMGLVYDKTFIINTTDDYANMTLSPYADAVKVGIKQLEEVIDICEKNTFDIPGTWIPGDTYSNLEIAELAHSYIARLAVYSPRNKTQNDAIDWSFVLLHAEKGISKDFAPLGDGVTGSWKSYYHMKTADAGWGKTDMRVINLMDNNMPSTFPESGLIADLPNDGLATSADARLLTDFQYDPDNKKPERGYYRWSSYRYKRLDDYILANGVNMRIIEFRKAENDLFIAEAKLNLLDVAGAAAVINAGTRSTRGNLPDVDASDATAVADAIWYERNIELVLTGLGVEFFDMRRNDLLQKGTMLHFPIPAQQLQLIPLPFYTFGGDKGVAGEDYSIGGWK